MNSNDNLRIIIIDDNQSIHQDFLKILTTSENHVSNNTDLLTSLENQILKESENNKTVLPKFEIDTASQGEEGFNKIFDAISKGIPYALAFVDIRMPPGWDGIETIKHIWEVDKHIQIVICTAYSDYTWEETVGELGQSDNLLILKKPFDNVSVRQLAYALTKKWQLIQEAQNYTLSLEERIYERTESLKNSLALMRATLESSAEGILVVNHNNQISDYNKKFIELWSVPDDIISTTDFKTLLEFMSLKINESSNFINEVNKATGNSEISIGNVRCNDNQIFEFYTQPYMVEDKIIGRVWSFRDITKRAFLEAKLQHQASHDLLTGLPNRVLLLEKIKHAILVSEKNATSFAILFLDLDRFKLINDSLSHEIGDEILCSVATRLKSVIYEHDILVRLGGDEFVIIMNTIQDNTSIHHLTDKLLNVFKDPFQIGHHHLMLSTSIGVSIYPQDGKSTEVLLRNADAAMYHAKSLGANQMQLYVKHLDKKNIDKLQTETELRQALIQGEFFLEYQPQFDLKSQRLVSLEALIRWNHPTKGLILPMDFIPQAEESGLIGPIGEWVLRTACHQNKAWQLSGLPPIRMAVNVSTKQFRIFNFAKILESILNECQLEPIYLELELTENIILNNIDLIKTIQDIKNLGVQIALDDFGTGYSSLNYLREIPIDRIKIDQSYVQNLDANRGDDIIVQAIIAMAKNLNLKVVAEGVETQKQLEFLGSKQCAEVQGFYLSKPLSTKDSELLLQNCLLKNTVINNQ